MYCPKCGKKINESDFCPECGADTSEKKTNGAKIGIHGAGIIAYIGLIGWLVAYFLGDTENEYLRFHLNQSLPLAIAEIILSWIGNHVGGVLSVVVIIVDIALFICWIIGIIGGLQGRKEGDPLLWPPEAPVNPRPRKAARKCGFFRNRSRFL